MIIYPDSWFHLWPLTLGWFNPDARCATHRAVVFSWRGEVRTFCCNLNLEQAWAVSNRVCLLVYYISFLAWTCLNCCSVPIPTRSWMRLFRSFLNQTAMDEIWSKALSHQFLGGHLLCQKKCPTEMISIWAYLGHSLVKALVKGQMGFRIIIWWLVV